MSAGGLAAPFHRMEPEDVLVLLRDRYGLTGSLKRFDTEKDDTLLVTCPEGDRIVLKIANPLESEQEIALQLELLRYIRDEDPSLAVPHPVETDDGSLYFWIEDRAGQRRIVRALSFLDGTPLDQIDSTSLERERLGRVLGRLRLAMQDFSHPHDSREIAWDVKHLSKLRGLLSHIQDPGHRTALEKGFERFEAIHPTLADCRSQVLHNDCSRSNIVVDRDRSSFVTGIIDFGDVVRTAIAIDVSTTLLNQLPETARPDLFAEGKDVLAGYLRVADLTEAELAVVPHLVMARIVARALITSWRAAQFPENAQYIMRNTHQGWSQLDWFLSRSVGEVTQTLTGMSATSVKTRERA